MEIGRGLRRSAISRSCARAPDATCISTSENKNCCMFRVRRFMPVPVRRLRFPRFGICRWNVRLTIDLHPPSQTIKPSPYTISYTLRSHTPVKSVPDKIQSPKRCQSPPLLRHCLWCQVPRASETKSLRLTITVSSLFHSPRAPMINDRRWNGARIWLGWCHFSLNI